MLIGPIDVLILPVVFRMFVSMGKCRRVGARRRSLVSPFLLKPMNLPLLSAKPQRRRRRASLQSRLLLSALLVAVARQSPWLWSLSMMTMMATS